LKIINELLNALNKRVSVIENFTAAVD
jgi:hypothetical protein